MSLHTSRTVAVLKAMEKDELKDFSDFIQSAFSKSSPMVRKSFEYLKSCAPEFDKRQCTKELFSQKVFARKLDKTGGMEINRLMSELSEALERFITMKFADGDLAVKYDALMRWHSRKKLDWHLNKIFKGVEHNLHSNRTWDIRMAYYSYLQHKLNYYSMSGDRKQSFLIFTHIGRFWKKYYEIESLQSDIGLANLKNIMGKELLAEMQSKKTHPEFLPIKFEKEMRYYRRLSKFVVSPDIPTYNFLLKCFDDESLLVSRFDKNRLLSILNNNLRRLFSGIKFSEECIGMLHRMAEMKRDLYGGRVDAFLYRDMMLMLCRLNRISEADAFQKDIGYKIMGVQDTNNFISLYQAHVLFEKKQFAEALKLASVCKAEFTKMGIDMRLLKVKIAYEMNDLRQLEAHINTLRKFVATKIKKEMNPYFETQISRFTIYMLKLAKIKPGEHQRLRKLQSEVEADKLLNEKMWVMEKIEEKMLIRKS